MRFLFKAILTLVIMAVLAVAALAWVVPEEVVRDRVAEIVKQQTGRSLAVRGKTSFTVYPDVGVELGDVSLSNPPGMKGGSLLSMATLTLDLKLWPLLTRRVEIERFILERPVFNLHIDQEGRKNWDFRKAADAGTERPEKAARAAAPHQREAMKAQAGSGLGNGMVQDIRLGTVRIIDGVVKYSDERDGTRQRLDALNGTLVQSGLSEPLNAEGKLVWRGEEIAFNARLGALTALLRGAPSAMRLALNTRHGKGSFEGQVALAPALEARGDVSGESPSARALAAWLGNPLPRGGGLGQAAVSGQLAMKGNKLTFSKARVALDGMKGQGQATIHFRKPRPYVSAALALDRLDLNPYLNGTASRPGGTSGAARRASPSGSKASSRQGNNAPKPGAGQSLTEFIEQLNRTEQKGKSRPEPQVRGWSERAIDLSGLYAVDADLKLTAGRLFYKEIKTGEAAVTASLKDGLLTADLTRLALYSGKGSGRVTVNGARDVPALAAKFELNGLSALPFFTDAADFDWISGKARLDFSLSGTGRAQNEIVRNLQGKGSLHFSDGAIEGINIPAMIRGLQKGQLDGWRREEKAKTDFTELSGAFTMKNGVARNDDLKMVSPLLRVTGEGTVDLPRERLDYSALPRIVASLQGQGGKQDLEGLTIPVKIKGHWSDPKFVPDLERMLKDPDMTRNAVEKVGKAIQNLKEKKITGDDVERLLQGVLGGGQEKNSGENTKDGQKKQDAKEFLKKLLQ